MTAPALTARPARFFVGMGSTALALALGATPLVLSASASAAPGTNGQGTITVHDAATGQEVSANQPKVCGFRLVAAGYPASKTTFSYDFQDKTTGALHVAPGVIRLTGGTGQTGVLWLAKDHMYKPHGAGPDESGQDNFKVFKETCAEPTGGGTGGSTAGGSTGTPTGGSTGTPAGGSTGTPAGGSTAGTTAGGSGGNDGPSTGGNTAPPSAGGTGGFSGGGTGAVLTDPIPVTAPVTHRPVTGGGGKVTVTKTATKPVTKPVIRPAAKPATRTTRPAAKALPFTGDHTSTFALWGLASVVGGIGFTMLGQRKGRHAL